VVRVVVWGPPRTLQAIRNNFGEFYFWSHSTISGSQKGPGRCPWPKWTKISVFEGQKHLTPHRQRRTRWSLHHPHPSACRACHENGNATPCVRAGTWKNCKNTEFVTILEMGLHEAYAGRGVAVFAYEAIKYTHRKHPAALGFNRG
jgi:hypothetical protein